MELPGSFFGILTILLSAVTFLFAFQQQKTGRETRALVLLFLGGAILRVWAGSDPFLHEWDERYHALVAKHLIDHPLKPTLYATPVLPFDFKDWGANHIWLSKPPLPLWIMACSLWSFGINEIGLRIPSFVFSILSILLTFQIGKALFSWKTGFLAAFFHAIHGLWLEVSGGRLSSDHVDTLFLLCFQLGMWFLVLFWKKKENKYLVFFGAMTGFAYLCKYSVAFFLVIIWLSQKIYAENFSVFKQAKQILWASIPFFIIVLPWQLYTLWKFPEEAHWMYQQIFSPVTSTIQGHSGNLFYYIFRIGTIFGELIYIPVTWLAYSFLRGRNTWKIQLLFFWITMPVLLFSLAATKRHTYILVCASAIFVLTALFIRVLSVYMQKSTKIKPVAWVIIVCLFLLPIRYSIERTKPFDLKLKKQPEWLVNLKNFSHDIDQYPSKVILINEQHSIEAMFYTGYLAYPFIPDNGTLQKLKAEGYIIFINHGGTYYLQ